MKKVMMIKIKFSTLFVTIVNTVHIQSMDWLSTLVSDIKKSRSLTSFMKKRLFPESFQGVLFAENDLIQRKSFKLTLALLR